MKDRSRPWKILITVICLFFAAFASLGMFLHYEPLARYPYGTAEEQQILESRLSAADIDYLINSQLMPQTILPFIDAPGFNIKNTLYYYTALKTRNGSPDAIVAFVNEFRDRFDYNTLEDYLRWYNYQDLTEFFRSGSSKTLAQNPADPLLVLNGDTTVYSWKPDGLAEEDGLILKQDALFAFNQLRQLAQEEGLDMAAENGYISYGQAKAPGFAGSEYPDQQLGTSIMLDAGPQWDLNWGNMTSGDQMSDYEQAIEMLPGYEEKLLYWLQDNAWRAGFIIRYPRDKEEVTGHAWQPFFIRYVGNEAAAAMHANGWSLEEYVQQQDNGSNHRL